MKHYLGATPSFISPPAPPPRDPRKSPDGGVEHEGVCVLSSHEKTIPIPSQYLLVSLHLRSHTIFVVTDCQLYPKGVPGKNIILRRCHSWPRSRGTIAACYTLRPFPNSAIHRTAWFCTTTQKRDGVETHRTSPALPSPLRKKTLCAALFFGACYVQRSGENPASNLQPCVEGLGGRSLWSNDSGT